MRKNIATYGIALLSTMLIVRAATMEKRVNPNNLIGRNAELPSQALLNTSYRNAFEKSHEPNRLIASTVILENLADHKQQFKPKYRSIEQNDFELLENSSLELTAESDNNVIIALPSILEETKLTEELSLDRENTINNTISLLFPRKQINPKPKDL